MKGRRGKRRLAVAAVLILVLTGGILWLYSLDSMELGITRYTLETEKLTADLKIALLSDLHNEEFGEGNSVLVQEIADYSPDVILMCGDMVNRNDPDVHVVLELCEKLTPLADVYYIYGNHEGVLQYAPEGPQVPLDQYLFARDVKLMYGGVYSIPHEGGRIDLLAKSIVAEQYYEDPATRELVARFMEKDSFKIVMTHFPDLIYDALADQDFDLAVAGHYHGGQVILPGIGGLFHGDTGLFPEYYGGAYRFDYGTLVLSRGLGNGTIFPRINNDPELVFIDVKAA